MSSTLSESIKIVLLGLRNAGKSSTMNNLFKKSVSIISNTPGTTTDPVTRKMELGKLGPVGITDTAGIDDIGELGELRIDKSIERAKDSNIIIFVTPIDKKPETIEKDIINKLKNKNIVIAASYGDKEANQEKLNWLNNFTWQKIDNNSADGIIELIIKLESLHKKIDFEPAPMDGLVNESDLVLLVTPIDLAAPKGRLILPQVETIRDLLDKDCASLVVKERELKYYYDKLGIKPKLVVTDSQAFSKVAADLPDDQALTSFSILFARKKGDLEEFIKGVKALENIQDNDNILIMESCSHHRQADDIGTVKIPRLFRQMVNPNVNFEFSRDLPKDFEIDKYKLIIHCAACMITRNKMLNRIEKVKEKGIAITNYGVFLSWANGLIPRALLPFPEIRHLID